METTPAAVTAGRPYRKLAFVYDWTGRRLARTITDTNNTVLSATRWLYERWNPVAEYSAQTTGQTLVRTYLWGMDLSGTMQGAGGVGGLLSVDLLSSVSGSSVYHPSFDGNGNVTTWTQSGASAPVCVREYDAFGNVVVEQGTAPCAFGFSTKLEDPETGLLYYGHRYYCPPLGRWLNQDPIEENGGLNLYGFVGNGGVNRWDCRGMISDVLIKIASREADLRQRNIRRSRTRPSVPPDGEGGWFTAYSAYWYQSDLALLNLLWNTPGTQAPGTPKERSTERIIRKATRNSGNLGFTEQDFDGEVFIDEHPDGCFYLRVALVHHVYDVAINNWPLSKIGGVQIQYYDVVAHELAHIRAYAARLFLEATNESAKVQPCYTNMPDAITASREMARVYLLAMQIRVQDLESSHDETNWEVIGTPPGNMPVPWVGPTPEEAYGH